MPLTSDMLASDELILLMGGPGSGKGTLGRELAVRLGAEVRSTGQLLRDENDPDIAAYLDRGDLVPEAELERVLTSAVHALAGKPLILDGATKKPHEAQWLLGKLLAFERRLVGVLYLEIDEAVAMRRILDHDRGRHDDAPEYQDHRWHEFHMQTLKSIEVYREAGLLEAIDGSQPAGALVEQALGLIRDMRTAIRS